MTIISPHSTVPRGCGDGVSVFQKKFFVHSDAKLRQKSSIMQKISITLPLVIMNCPFGYLYNKPAIVTQKLTKAIYVG